jgi:hypothetical protein
MSRKNKHDLDDPEIEKNSRLVSWLSMLTWLGTCACVYAVSKEIRLGWELVCIDIFLMWAGNTASGRISSHDSVRLVRELVRPASILAARVKAQNLFSDLSDDDRAALDGGRSNE